MRRLYSSSAYIFFNGCSLIFFRRILTYYNYWKIQGHIKIFNICLFLDIFSKNAPILIIYYYYYYYYYYYGWRDSSFMVVPCSKSFLNPQVVNLSKFFLFAITSVKIGQMDRKFWYSSELHKFALRMQNCYCIVHITFYRAH